MVFPQINMNLSLEKIEKYIPAGQPLRITDIKK